MNGPGTVNNRTQVQVPLDQNETVYIDTPQPNVYNIALASLQTVGSIDVEKFLGGAPNQELKVRASGLVTLKHNFGGMGRILLNTGADKLLDENKIYTFTYVDDAWLEAADGGGGSGPVTMEILTINDSNSGASSPASYDGSSPITISANTVGAVALADFVTLGDAEWVRLDGAYANPAWITSLAYSKLTGAPSLSGYVVGPASATDNALVRFDGTTGKLVQDSGLFLSDASVFSAATISSASTIPITINATNALLTLIGRGVTIKPGAITPFKVRDTADTEDTLTVADTVKIKSATTPQLRIEDSFFYALFGLTGSGNFEYNVVSPNPLHSFVDPVKISGVNSGGPSVYILEVTGEGNTASTIIGIGSLPFTAQSGTVTNLISAQFDIANTGIGDVTNAYGLVIEDITIGTSINRAISTGLGDILFGSLAGVGSRMVVASATGLLSTSAIPTGDVVGPASAVNNNLAAFDLTTGKLIKDSLIPSANVIVSSGSYANPAWITSLAYAKLTGAPSLTGYVVGPASATDNAIAVYDLTTGKLIKNSSLLISGTTIPALTGVGTLASGAIPASLITAGTFGTGAYTVSGTFRVNSNTDGPSPIYLRRFSASGRAEIGFENEAGTLQWRFGMTGVGSSQFNIFDSVNSVNAFAVVAGATPAITITGSLTVTSTLTQNGTAANLAQSSTTADLTVGSGSGSGASSITVKGVAGTNRSVALATGGSWRWAIVAGTGAESGANAGSAFSLGAYSDAGSFIDAPISIVRAAAGAITFVRPLVGTSSLNITGAATFQSSVTLSGATAPGNMELSAGTLSVWTNTINPSVAIRMRNVNGTIDQRSWDLRPQTTGALEIRSSTDAGTTVFTALSLAHATGALTLFNLAGVGTRMVTADASGVLSTTAIPSGTFNTAYAPGSISVATGNFAIHIKELQLTSTQRLSVAGTARFRLSN